MGLDRPKMLLMLTSTFSIGLGFFILPETNSKSTWIFFFLRIVSFWGPKGLFFRGKLAVRLGRDFKLIESL